MIDENETVLFVCTANICRSPFMLYEFSKRSLQIQEDRGWSAVSAGVRAHPGGEICRSMRRVVSLDETGVEFAASHRSQPVTSELLQRSALVIAASDVERAALARLDPASRERTFTLKQAASLATRARERGWLERGLEPSLHTLARSLHLQRGRSAPVSARGFRLRRRDEDGLDILDVHEGQARHRGVQRSISDAVSTLVRAMDAAAV